MDFPPELLEEWARVAFEAHAETSQSYGRWDDLEDAPEERQAWIDVGHRVGALALAYAEGRLQADPSPSPPP